MPSLAVDDLPLSPHQQRLALVTRTLVQHSALDDAQARAVALHVLHALDHIPEKIR